MTTEAYTGFWRNRFIPVVTRFPAHPWRLFRLSAAAATMTPTHCGNKACSAETLAPFSWAMRLVAGHQVRLCDRCQKRFDAQKFCHFCEQIYDKDSSYLNNRAIWMRCCCCRHYVHTQCERKSGANLDQTQSEGQFSCSLCARAGCLVNTSPRVCRLKQMPTTATLKRQCMKTKRCCFNSKCRTAVSNSWLSVHPIGRRRCSESWLCESCAIEWKHKKVCPYCEEFYAVASRSESKSESTSNSKAADKLWLKCDACDRTVHVCCEVKAGYKDAETIHADFAQYHCPDCRLSLPPPRPKTTFYEFTQIMLNEAARTDPSRAAGSPSRGVALRRTASDVASLSKIHSAGGKSIAPCSAPMTTATASVNGTPTPLPSRSVPCSAKRKLDMITSLQASPVSVSKKQVSSIPNTRITVMQHTNKASKWIQCDNARCLKWRRIPNDIDVVASLRGKWTCKMNKWDGQRSRCSADEEPIDSDERVEDQRGEDFERERSVFYSRLHQFLSSIGTSLSRNPTLGGKELDLFLLYREVTKRHGFDAVVSVEGTWARIFRSLDNYSASVTDASYRLKRYYQEILYLYEQRYFWNKPMEEVRNMCPTNISRRVRKRSTAAISAKSPKNRAQTSPKSNSVASSPLKPTMAIVTPPTTPASSQQQAPAPQTCFSCGFFRPQQMLQCWSHPGGPVAWQCTHCAQSAASWSGATHPVPLSFQMQMHRHPLALPALLRCTVSPNNADSVNNYEVASCL